jgi:hypothetical protein
MRKSIDDIPRRAEVSQNVNNRHLQALTSANTGEKFTTLIDGISAPIIREQVRVRGLDPLNKDRQFLDAIIEGKFHIGDFRNKDLRAKLFNSHDVEQEKRNSAKVSRVLRILRTHGLIKKIPRTHRYMMTAKGIELISALRTIENTNVSDLLKLAA